MDVFKLRPEDDDCIELSTAKFRYETGTKSPWFTRTENKAAHFAVCPECDNPTQIIGLDIDRKADESGQVMALHARHVPRDIPGIALYDRDAYESCPLAKPETFSGTPLKRKAGKKSDEILSLLIEDADTVKSFMETALGISISPPLFERILEQFAEKDGHLYRAIGKLNLPYAVIYMAGNQCVAGDGAFNMVKKSISSSQPSPFEEAASKSQNFELGKWRAIKFKSTADKTARMVFFIEKHVIPAKAQNGETPDQILKLCIEEEIKGQRFPLVTADIRFDVHYFYNTVSKKRRERATAERILAHLKTKAQ